MANETIGIDIVTRLDQFRAEMAKIPGITSDQAKAMAAQLSREVKASERAAKAASASMRRVADDAKKAGDATAKAGGGLRALTMQLPDVASQLSGGASPLTILTQQGGQVVQSMMASGTSVASLASTVAGAAVPVAALAVVLGALYGAFQSLNEEQDRASEKVRLQNEAYQSLKPLLADTEDAYRRLAVATGEVSSEQAKLNANAREGFSAYQTATEASRKKLAELKAEQDSVSTQLVDWIGGAFDLLQEKVGGDGSSVWYSLFKGSEEVKGEISAVTASLAGAVTELEKNVQANNKATVAEDKAAKAKQGASKAAEAHREALRLEREELERAEAASDAWLSRYRSSVEALDDVSQANKLAMLDAEARLNAEHEASLTRIADLEREALSATTTQAGREAAEAASRGARLSEEEVYNQRLNQLRTEDVAKAKAASEAKAKADADAASRAQQARVDAVALGGQLATEALSGAAQAQVDAVAAAESYLEEHGDNLTKSQRKQLRARIAAEKEAARRAFEAQKGAALATAAVQTAVAVTQALASAPFPLNLVPAAAAGAAGAAQQAAIASTEPAFHTGGPVGRERDRTAPDETYARLRAGEFVLNPTGRKALGDEALNRANAGQASGSGEVVAVSVYRHTRQVERWKRDGLVRNDPIAQAVNRGRKVGHR